MSTWLEIESLILHTKSKRCFLLKLSAVGEVGQLKHPPLPPEGGVEGWSEHSGEEEEDINEPSIALLPLLKAKESHEPEELKQVLPTLERRPSLGQETSLLSVQSDSTLEFHDAPSPADVLRPSWQPHNRLDEDDEVAIRHPESSTVTGTLPAEKPNVDQEFKMQPAAEGDPESWNKELTTEGEVENSVVVPVLSLEESNQDDSLNPEIVLVPREPIKTSGMSEEMIREEEIGGSEPAPPPVTDADVTVEEPLRESPKDSESHDSVERSVVNNQPIGELLAFPSGSVSEELGEKPEAMETSGEAL